MAAHTAERIAAVLGEGITECRHQRQTTFRVRHCGRGGALGAAYEKWDDRKQTDATGEYECTHTPTYDKKRGRVAEATRPRFGLHVQPARSAGRSRLGFLTLGGRDEVVAVHLLDDIDADLLRAGFLTLTNQRAVSEALDIHLLDHG